MLAVTEMPLGLRLSAVVASASSTARPRWAIPGRPHHVDGGRVALRSFPPSNIADRRTPMDVVWGEHVWVDCETDVYLQVIDRLRDGVLIALTEPRLLSATIGVPIHESPHAPQTNATPVCSSLMTGSGSAVQIECKKSSGEAIGTPKRFAWSAFPEWVDRRAGRNPSR